jgi:hypothetical protein
MSKARKLYEEEGGEVIRHSGYGREEDRDVITMPQTDNTNNFMWLWLDNPMSRHECSYRDYKFGTVFSWVVVCHFGCNGVMCLLHCSIALEILN